MCMIDDDAGWKVFRQVERAARKDYRCGECRRSIAKGERYLYSTGLSYDWDTWSTFRTCVQCVQANRWLITVCDGYMFEMTHEDLAHHVRGEEEGYMSSSALVRIVRWQEARWLDHHGDLRPVDQVRPVVDRAIEAAHLKLNPPLETVNGN